MICVRESRLGFVVLFCIAVNFIIRLIHIDMATPSLIGKMLELIFFFLSQAPTTKRHSAKIH